MRIYERMKKCVKVRMYKVMKKVH